MALSDPTLRNDSDNVLKQKIVFSIIEQISSLLSLQDLFVFLFLVSSTAEIENPSELDLILDNLQLQFSSIQSHQKLDFSQGDPFDHLKFSNLEGVFQLFFKIITQTFSRKIFNFYPAFQIDSLFQHQMSVVYILEQPNPSKILDFYFFKHHISPCTLR